MMSPNEYNEFPINRNTHKFVTHATVTYIRSMFSCGHYSITRFAVTSHLWNFKMNTMFLVLNACVLIAATVSSKPVNRDHNDGEGLNEVVHYQGAVYLKVLGLSHERTKRQIVIGSNKCPSDKMMVLNSCDS